MCTSLKVRTNPWEFTQAKYIDINQSLNYET